MKTVPGIVLAPRRAAESTKTDGRIAVSRLKGRQKPACGDAGITFVAASVIWYVLPDCPHGRDAEIMPPLQAGSPDSRQSFWEGQAQRFNHYRRPKLYFGNTFEKDHGLQFFFAA